MLMGGFLCRTETFRDISRGGKAGVVSCCGSTDLCESRVKEMLMISNEAGVLVLINLRGLSRLRVKVCQQGKESQ